MKNKKPEEIVKKEVLEWLRLKGFSCNVIESKAVYSVAAGRYLRGQTDKGMSDIVGASPNGDAVFIELKAPGKLRNISREQKFFLLDKMNHYAFACVVDSPERLAGVWAHFVLRQKHDKEAARKFLFDYLAELTD